MDQFIDADGVLLTRAEHRAGLGKGRVRLLVTDFEPSIVDESKRDDADLNVLVRRWMKGQAMPQFAPAQFGDVSEAVSFQDVQERLLKVEQAFYSLPADVREHFANSAVKFADAMVDPARTAELVEIGVLAPPPGEPSVVVAPAAPAVVPPVVP